MVPPAGVGITYALRRKALLGASLVLAIALWVLCVPAPSAAYAYDEQIRTYDVGLNSAAHATRSVDALSTIVFLTDALDVDQVSAFLDCSYATNAIDDLAEVGFIDSSGLATLIEALQAVGKYGGKLRLCGLAPDVRKLFDLAQLSTIFDLRDTREDAVAD